MFVPVIIIGIIFLFIGVFIVVINFNRAQRRKLEALASNLGLELRQGSWAEQPKLVGKYQDRPVEIKNIYHSTGKSGYFTYRATLTSKSAMKRVNGINISHQGGSPGLFTKIGRAFTPSTITLDNPEFDTKVILKAYDGIVAREFIDVELQQDVLNMGRGTTAIKDGTIFFEAYGQAQDKPDQVAEALRYLYKIEEKLLRLSPELSMASADPAYTGSYDNDKPRPRLDADISAKDVEMEFLDNGKKYYTGD
jgi:hypothetical protein